MQTFVMIKVLSKSKQKDVLLCGKTKEIEKIFQSHGFSIHSIV